MLSHMAIFDTEQVMFLILRAMFIQGKGVPTGSEMGGWV
jgi:hypothetical protein